MYEAKAQFHATMLWSFGVSMIYVFVHFLKRCITEHPSVIYKIESERQLCRFVLIVPEKRHLFLNILALLFALSEMFIFYSTLKNLCYIFYMGS